MIHCPQTHTSTQNEVDPPDLFTKSDRALICLQKYIIRYYASLIGNFDLKNILHLYDLSFSIHS